MNKKSMIITAAACIISLCIGTAIGMGINQGGLSATAAAGGNLASGIKDPGSINIPDIPAKFTELYMEQAEKAKQQANDMMRPILEKQEKLKQAADILAEMRQLMHGDNEGKKAMTQSIYDGCKTLGIAISGNIGDVLKRDEWESNIDIVRNYQDRLSSDIQNDMIKLQSSMSEYNKLLQSVNDVISSQMELLARLASGR